MEDFRLKVKRTRCQQQIEYFHRIFVSSILFPFFFILSVTADPKAYKCINLCAWELGINERDLTLELAELAYVQIRRQIWINLEWQRTPDALLKWCGIWLIRGRSFIVKQAALPSSPDVEPRRSWWLSSEKNLLYNNLNGENRRRFSMHCPHVISRMGSIFYLSLLAAHIQIENTCLTQFPSLYLSLFVSLYYFLLLFVCLFFLQLAQRWQSKPNNHSKYVRRGACARQIYNYRSHYGLSAVQSRCGEGNV